MRVSDRPASRSKRRQRLRHQRQRPQRRLPTRPVNLPGYRLRLILLGVLLGLGVAGLATRLIWLQVKLGPELRAEAAAQQTTKTKPEVALHSIVDRSGNILAQDEPMYRLYAHPIIYDEDPAEHRAIAQSLAAILQRPAAELEQLLKSGKSGIPIEGGLTEKVANEVRALHLDGLELTREWLRVYPQQDLTAGIVGYVNADHIGQAGLEYSQRSLLAAQTPARLVSRDGRGKFLPNQFPLRPLRADEANLKLTLDSRLQRAARMALEKQMRAFKARRGTLIVMDVDDGSLLALASSPSFNPEKFYEADPALFRNWAITDLYEPGSTFKPINVAIALDADAIQPDTIVYDEGNIVVGGWPIQNNDGSGNGSINITKVLEVSSNVGMVRIMERMQRKTFYRYLEKIGIGTVTGTDLPFETAGQIKNKQQFLDYPIESATTAFGQGFSVTPLQMAQLHAAIANGGVLVTPHVTDGLYDTDDQKIKTPNLTPRRRVFSQEAADSVRQMMGSVVQNGTGQAAKIPGYRLGGKTGTAQKAAGGTYLNARITSFVASFPLEKPKYVAIAVVDEPQGSNAYGSTVAAPAVKSVLETLISVEGIPPSHPNEITERQEKEKAASNP